MRPRSRRQPSGPQEGAPRHRPESDAPGDDPGASDRAAASVDDPGPHATDTATGTGHDQHLPWDRIVDRSMVNRPGARKANNGTARPSPSGAESVPEEAPGPDAATEEIATLWAQVERLRIAFATIGREVLQLREDVDALQERGPTRDGRTDLDPSDDWLT